MDDNATTKDDVHGAFNVLKRGARGVYHRASPKHLNRYVDATAGRGMTYKELTA